MKVFLSTLLFAMAVHDSFGLHMGPVIPIVEPIIEEYGLECSIKDIDTDITKEKQELIDAFRDMRIKIRQEKDEEPNKSALKKLVNQDCRKNETLKLLSQKLVDKAVDCLVSSNLDETKSEIVQEIIKSGCDAVFKLIDWTIPHPH